jgi:hypothetical protein
MEARPPDCHDQMREREEAERMPRMVTAVTARARWNQATKSPVTHGHQRGRERLGLGLGSSRVRVRRGAADWAGLVWSNPLGLT